MIKFRRGAAVITVAAMIFSMTACGDSSSGSSKKDKSSKSNKKKIESVETISDAVEAATCYTQGSYNLTVNWSMTSNSEYYEYYECDDSNVNFSIFGDIDDGDYTIGMSTDYIPWTGAELGNSINMSEVIVQKNNILYLNLDSIAESVLDENTDFGSISFPLPEVESSGLTSVQSLVEGYVQAAFDGFEVSGSGNEYTLTLSSGQDFKTFFQNIINYVDENQSEIQNAVNEVLSSSGSIIDYDKYFDTLVDYYKDDIISAAALVGYELSEDEYDSYAAMAKEEYDDALDEAMEGAQYEVDIFEDWDDIKEEFADLDDEDFDNAFKGTTMTLTVYAGTDSYKVDFTMTQKTGFYDIEMSFNYEFDVKNVSVKKPGNTTTFTGLLTYAMNNQELFESLEDIASLYGLN